MRWIFPKLHEFSSQTMMEQNRLNLRWNNHTMTFVSKLDQFRVQELYCDATIACDGQIYPVHRVVLSACSEFFASIFASTRCHNPVVVLQDVGQKQLESLLVYMYRGEVRVLQEDLPTFIKVAESLHVKGLAGPTSESHQEHQAERVCYNSYYGPAEEIQHGDTGSRPPLPKVQPMPYIPEVLSLSSQRMIQNFSHDERSLFQQGRAGEISSKRKSHEMDYARQNDNDFQRRPQVIEHGHHLHQNEAPVKIPRKMEHVQHLKKDEIQAGHPRDAGHQMQSLGASDHNGRVRVSEHSPRKSPSGESIFRPSSDAKFRPNPANELERRNDLIKENACRSDGTQDARTTLSNGFIPESIGSGDHVPRPHVPAEHMSKKVCDSSKDESTEYSSLQYNSFHVSSTNGTFQNLVASEENPIKNEPEDSLTDDYENASLSLSEDFEDTKDDESDSFTLKIAEEASPCEESANPEKYKEMSKEEQSVADSMPSEPLPATEPHIPRPPGMPPSQLRRELLRPIHHKAGPKHIPPSVPQSIPHPVIAPRDPERHLREPPPLMKIDPKVPLLINEAESERPPKYSRKDSQENGHSSHLLVKAPPTYHSHTSPIHFSLHVHNQHLGSVMVNGGAPISEIPSNSQNDRLPVSVNDGPLNLSGQKSPPETEEKDSQSDPFLGKIITNRKKRLRGPKSWEFLVRLLKDTTTNPFLIRWENEESGVFRLVQPAAIAQRWGRRTGKHASECLSYENFARGLRYHYATGALQPVSERSFVYRFGPKALKTLKQCDSASFPYL